MTHGDAKDEAAGESLLVPAADGWFPETDGLRFNGYLVDLRRVKG